MDSINAVKQALLDVKIEALAARQYATALEKKGVRDVKALSRVDAATLRASGITKTAHVEAILGARER